MTFPPSSNAESPDLPILTFDVDWAPSWVIQRIASSMIAAEVRATWFVTHEVEVLELLRSRPDLFELGIHPNFQRGSTQGDNPADVLKWCMELVPEAAAVRTHGLLQSTPILDDILTHTPVRTDLSLFLHRATGAQPIVHERPHGRLVRLPYVWEDDLEMGVTDPEWSVEAVLGRGPGIKILDFHPLHVVMNAVDLNSYTLVKRLLTEPARVSPELVEPLSRQGAGPGQLLEDLIVLLSSFGGGSRVSDVVARYPALGSPVGHEVVDPTVTSDD